ncbi:MAG: (Fe-S)-binding protein [Bacteroidales bacterium]|nr:(Fe-S)-binding protein [Bacteroidales bacterium]MCF8403584.1 (Fe-S)-binding protein [Bacteroidales bacterium]
MERPTQEKIKKGLEVLNDKADSKLLTHMNSCVHCGLCAKSCVYYNANPEAKFIPATKVDLVASIYRRYNTLSGKFLPGLVGARELDEKTMDEMVDLLFGACTMCGRCVKHCSVGVDISYVVRKGREMLSNMGLVPESLQSTINSALETGNNMAIPTEEFVETLQWLEEDLQFEVNDDNAEIPLDQMGKDVLYTLNPREPKFFPLSISAMAKVFHVANESWTISTKMYDVTNYAYYSGNLEEAAIIALRLHDEMENLEAKTCVLAECGHGSRAFRWEGPNYIKKEYPFEVISSVELLAKYLRNGRIKTNPALITDKVTLHDPCNLVRSGGICQEQRYILGKCVTDFVEMTPHGIDNICCGGGGGQLAMSEYNERRMAIGKLKAEQIRATGAKIVATPCHNCVDQLTQLNVTYKLNIQIKTLCEIVADAIVLENQTENEES